MSSSARDQEPNSSHLEILLQHELASFSSILGWGPDGPEPLSDELATALLGTAERLSRRATTERERATCVALCGLLWEHRREQWTSLAPLLLRFLIRLDLAPSAAMVNTDQLGHNHKFSALGSLRWEVEATARIIDHEVSVTTTQGPSLTLSRFQKRLWDALGHYSRIGVSAPTSAGKSFVLVHRVLSLLEPSHDAVYVVPTLTLIQQVTEDFRKAAIRFGKTELRVSQTVTPNSSSTNSTVYVLTQERAQAALARPENFNPLSIVVFDEVQNIERLSTDGTERAETLYDTIHDFQSKAQPKRIVLSGPRIAKMLELSRTLLGDTAEAIADDLPPVVNLTYSLKKFGNSYSLQQHSTFSSTKPSIPLPRFPVDVRTTGKRYGDPIFDLLAAMVTHLRKSGVLVFSPTSGQANRTGLALAERRQPTGNETQGQPQRRPTQTSRFREQLAAYLRQSVHPSYALADCVRVGVGYHHGKMPQHARFCVEHAFRIGIIDTVACTTTLMQGVNLPAKTLIARNPNLFINQTSTSSQLTEYEFSNLRGRAGRLMKDFIGRTIVLDDDSFTDANIDIHLPPAHEVEAGYKSRFNTHRDAILDELASGQMAANSSPAPDLLVRIRQALLRHGRGARRRLLASGISVTNSDIAHAAQQIAELSVPRQICLQLPYWDPMAVEAIYRRSQADDFLALPRRPQASNFVDTLEKTLDTLLDCVPYYYRKYLGQPVPKERIGILVSAQGWASQKPLRDILSRRTDSSIEAEELDRRIKTVASRVSYELGKLLRPLLLIQDETNPLLAFLELGAYQPSVRRLIGLGIPRETACELVRAGVDAELGERDDEELLREVARTAPMLSVWETEQVAAVLPSLNLNRITPPTLQ